MSEKTVQDNKVLVDFWSEVLDLSEVDREELGKCSAEDWKELAPSEKLFAWEAGRRCWITAATTDGPGLSRRRAAART